MLTDTLSRVGEAPVELIFSPSAAKRTGRDEAGACGGCCSVVCLIVGHAALSAGMGAAAGSIGFQVMQSSQQWTVPGINHLNFVQSMAAGSAALSPAHLFCTIAYAGLSNKEDDKTSQPGIVFTLLTFGGTGALNGMAGAGMLGLLIGGEQIGFAAAAGASGQAILSAGIIALICFLACCLGSIALCNNPNKHGSISLLDIPTNSFKFFMTQNTELKSNLNLQKPLEKTPEKIAIERHNVPPFSMV